MANFKINPDLIIRNNHFINSHITELNSLVIKFENKYHELDARVRGKLIFDIAPLKSMVSDQMLEKTEFLTQIVQSLLDATGYSEAELLAMPANSNETLAFYEHCLLKAYAKKHLREILNAEEFSIDYINDPLNVFYDFLVDGGNGKYHFSTEVVRYAKITNFLYEFKDETGHDFTTDFGITEKEIYDEFMYIYEQDRENHSVVDHAKLLFYNLKSLFNENFFTYNLSLNELENEVGNNNYSFMRTIMGHDVKFSIAASGNTTQIEKLLALFTHAIIIENLNNCTTSYVDNVLGTNMFEINVSLGTEEGWDAYGDYGNSGKEKIRVLLDNIIDDLKILDSDFIDQVFFHESGHAYDYHAGAESNWLTDSDKEKWAGLYEKYYDLLWEVQTSKLCGYSGNKLKSLDSYHRLKEFFAEAIRAYFTNPEGLRAKCPDLFDAISELMGG